MRLIVFDTEATDLSPGQLCQLAWLKVEDGNVTGRNMYFDVESMSEGAQAVHGMSLSDVRRLSGGLRFADRADEILADFEWAELLAGHNVAADVRYLRAELERLGLWLPERPAFCTMKHFTPITRLKRRIDTGHPKPPKLAELCAHYGLDDGTIAARCAEWFHGGEHAHDARFDAAATYLCLLEATRQGDVRGIL